MVLGYEVKQHGGFFFHRGIEVLPAKCLVYLSDRTLERIIFLLGEPLTSAKLGFQFFDSLHSTLVGGVELCLVRGLLYRQLLIIILIQRIEGIGIIGNDFLKIIPHFLPYFFHLPTQNRMT